MKEFDGDDDDCDDAIAAQLESHLLDLILDPMTQLTDHLLERIIF